MYPIDALTDKEISSYEKYLASSFLYTSENNVKISGRDSLTKWNKSKIRLFHAFGNRLRVSRRISVPRFELNYEIASKLRSLYYLPDAVDIDRGEYERDAEYYSCGKNPLVMDVIDFLNSSTNDSARYAKMEIFFEIVRYKNFIVGYIQNECRMNSCLHGVYIPSKGEKTFRALRKFLVSIGYLCGKNREFMLECFRNDISDIMTTNAQSFTATISIHPLDFLTMSDNDNDWTTCMSIKGDGCCRNGVISLMNSNMSFICYVSSDDSSYDVCGTSVASKAWRAIGYANKDILVIGKSYPYNRDRNTACAMSLAEDVFRSSVGWSYKYENQEYMDMRPLNHNEYNYDGELSSCGDKSIILYSGMEFYNDLSEDTSSSYLCCRNYVNRRKDICVTGKLTCICCGKSLYSHDMISTYRKDPLVRQFMRFCANDDARPICKDCREGGTHRD